MTSSKRKKNYINNVIQCLYKVFELENRNSFKFVNIFIFFVRFFSWFHIAAFCKFAEKKLTQTIVCLLRFLFLWSFHKIYPTTNLLSSLRIIWFSLRLSFDNCEKEVVFLFTLTSLQLGRFVQCEFNIQSRWFFFLKSFSAQR